MFSQGPKDALSQAVSKNLNPGPGAHDPHLLKSGTSKRMLGGSLGFKPLTDNGVPGPGTYQPDPNYPISSFKIVNKSELNEKQKFKLNE